MRTSRRTLIAIAVVALAVSTTSATASAKTTKPVPPCRLLFPEDLEPIFHQPWRKGVQQLGGACLWQKSTSAEVPPIIVSLLLHRAPSIKKAKKAFSKAADVTQELADQIEPVKDLGDSAFRSTLIGTDLVTVRVDRTIADIRVKRDDDSGKLYPDETVGVAAIVAARLTPSTKPSTKSGRKGK
jgi:hypothetical protein